MHSKASAYFCTKNNFENNSPIEIECNRFASELLLNDKYKNMNSPITSLTILKGFPKEFFIK